MSGTSEDPTKCCSEAIEEDIRRLMKEIAECKWKQVEADEKQRVASERFLLGLLEVIDAFERVFRNVEAKKSECTPQTNIWIGNFRTVYKLLANILSEQGVTPIESLGRIYDPNWHKPVKRILDLTRPEGTIDREERSGYMFQGALLRKAEVDVVMHEKENDGAE